MHNNACNENSDFKQVKWILQISLVSQEDDRLSFGNGHNLELVNVP